MRKYSLLGIVLLLVFLAALLLISSKQKTQVASSALTYEKIYVFFSPEDHCAEKVIYWIDRANSSIYIAMYSFTSDEIGAAVIRAFNRGVEVRVILEKNEVNQWSEYSKFKRAGVSVKLDGNNALMHNKFCIIDGKIVITGSYNFTKSAEEKNDENLLIIFSEEVAKKYAEEFNEMWSGQYGG